MVKNGYTDILESHDEIRQELTAIMVKKKISVAQLAREMDIHAATVMDFIKGKRKTGFEHLCIIIEWISKQRDTK
jgi:predicted transcriptional regulator